MPTLRVGDAIIGYEVRRSARAKRLRVVVSPGRIEVVAPAWVDAALIEEFVLSRRRWLYEKTASLRERALEALPRRFSNGAKILFRGRFLRLSVESAEIGAADLSYATAFHVRVPRELDGAASERVARDLVTSWLRDRALADARFFVGRHAPGLGVEPTALRIGRQKTLWGSCSKRGRISLNWRLVAAPRSIFEYVVVHELCHLVERNHGSRFWKLVGSLLPDYRVRRAWLKKHGVALG